MTGQTTRQTFEIVEQVSVLRIAETGWTRELGMVTWYNKPTSIDVRWWSPDKSKAGKGISMTSDEAKRLFEGLKVIFEKGGNADGQEL